MIRTQINDENDENEIKIMKTVDIERLGLILAVQAEIEGMKAHNKWCEIVGKSEMYSDNSFFKKAGEIRDIVYKHDDQL